MHHLAQGGRDRTVTFQVWALIVEGTEGVLRCEDGNGGRLLEKRIGYTDFPEPGIKLFCTDGVIMLPGEY